MVDFLFPGPKWGIELIRDGNRIDEHMRRFQPGDRYYPLLAMYQMMDFVLLNFTQESVEKERPCMFLDRKSVV